MLGSDPGSHKTLSFWILPPSVNSSIPPHGELELGDSQCTFLSVQGKFIDKFVHDSSGSPSSWFHLNSGSCDSHVGCLSDLFYSGSTARSRCCLFQVCLAPSNTKCTELCMVLGNGIRAISTPSPYNFQCIFSHTSHLIISISTLL